MAHSLKHRSDIDGLRAIGILPVVLNHIGLRGFGGGYVGVDVFFVISGYLITSILVRDLRASRHSIAEFYRRRILRILPALCVVLATSTVLGYFAMLPGELVNYARSLVATVLFASNILFYTQSGYFDAESHVKPLLHTWSLAVEEQFYILWPLLLAWFGVARVQRLRLMLLAVILLSLAASVVMQAWDRSAAFYLLPSRAWELGLGGTLALDVGMPRQRWLREALGAGGLAAILLCTWRYSELTDFPGLAALPPCLGAAALILTSNSRTLAGRALSMPPAVFIGRISYSLYLWHWPVVVFASIWLFRRPTPTTMAAEFAVSILLATLTWWFVERPFRSGYNGWSRRTVLGGSAALTTAIIASGVVLMLSGGAAGRFTAAQTAVASYSDRNDQASYRQGTCFIVGDRESLDDSCLRASGGGKPVIVLVGDSQAAHLWPGLSTLQDRFDILQATLAGCRPLLYPEDRGGRCPRFFRSTLGSWLPQHRPDAVLLAGNWQSSDLPLLETTLAVLSSAPSRLILVGPVPQYDVALPRLLAFASRNHDPLLPQRFLVPGLEALDHALRAMAAAHRVAYISLLDALCAAGQCRYWAEPSVPLQFDYGHFSAAGSRLAVSLISAEIEAAVRRKPN